MAFLYLSPSTQEYNPYVNGGNEEYYMNLLADELEPYLRASGISFFSHQRVYILSSMDAQSIASTPPAPA